CGHAGHIRTLFVKINTNEKLLHEYLLNGSLQFYKSISIESGLEIILFLFIQTYDRPAAGGIRQDQTLVCPKCSNIG
ncbi:MAG: hypothetical protein RBU28_08615, partial [Bacteroidales bacterium]|nr:hypothetical protein [Bacteroidales bacterium]